MRVLRAFLRAIINEVFLGFLAIVAAAITAIPWIFNVTAKTDSLLESAQWVIVGLFAVEYAAALTAAKSKAQFVLNPWRIVDAATVLIPLLTLIPGASGVLRSSPVLRLVRLARVVALGARASGVVTRREDASVAAQEQAAMQVRLMPLDGESPRMASWDEFVQWSKHSGAGWFSVSNVGPHNLQEVARGAGIDADFLQTHMLATSYPHIECTSRHLSLFVWVPKLEGGKVERNGLLLLAGSESVITLCRRPLNLMEVVEADKTGVKASSGFGAAIASRLLKVVLDRNEALVGRFEDELREMEDLPVRDSRPQFFERTFRLKKELSAAQADLWRLRGVLKELSEGRVLIPGSKPGENACFSDLYDTADYLYESVNNIREGVLSLIELHLNVVSFEMNRVMRVLAVVSVLGLIPAVIGGLFGMNLADNPWPFTLPQVTFAVVTGMITCLYFFLVKGWLR